MRLIGPIAKILGASTRDKGTSEPLISPPHNVTQGPGKSKIHGSPNAPENYAFCPNVEFIHQQHTHMCGDGCLNMLLAYKGKPHKKVLKHNPRGIFEGTTSDHLKRDLLNAGLVPALLQCPENRKWSAENLAAIINQYGPAICGGKRHFILVFGSDQNTIAYHDPWRGPNKRMSLDDFNKFLDWSDEDCVIAVDDPLSDQNDVLQSTVGASNHSTAHRVSLLIQRQERADNVNITDDIEMERFHFED